MNDNQFLQKIGLRIKQLRLKKRMSQAALARCCHFEKANMSRIEAGKTNFSILTLKKISESLDVGIVDTVIDPTG
jgi:transcriptional regulator with XRE-family HTH domain